MLCFAQEAPDAEPVTQQLSYFVKKVDNTSEIVIDGELNESVYSAISPASRFNSYAPTDKGYASKRTEVKVFYDDAFLYIGAVMYDSLGEFQATTLKRDFDFTSNDLFGIYIDPLQNAVNGYSFCVSPLGVQREGFVFQGGTFPEEDLNWDNKWMVETSRQADRWVAEIKIPFKVFRYPGNSTEWNINFVRNELASPFQSSWADVPGNVDIFNLAFLGKMLFEKPLKKVRTEKNFRPYVYNDFSKNYLSESDAIKNNLKVGTDAKIALNSSINLDLTVNPDFSQVDADEQITNLKQFEVFFPERRQFFLESADMFINAGVWGLKPFFSRRIGIGRDTNTNTIVQNPILYGAKITGKINPKTRIGILNTQTDRIAGQGISAQNYSTIALQRDITKRSSIKMMYNGREKVTDRDNDQALSTRLGMLETKFQSKSGKITVRLIGMNAFVSDSSRQFDRTTFAHASETFYNTRKLTVWAVHDYTPTGFQINDIGFARRLGAMQAYVIPTYYFYPKNKSVRFHYIRFMPWYNWNKDFQQIDGINQLTYNVTFNNLDELSVSISEKEEFILNERMAFDPSFTGGKKLTVGNGYSYKRIRAKYESNPARKLAYSFETNQGEHFHGRRQTYIAELGIRHQPYGQLSLRVDYNEINMPDGYNDAQILLVGAKLDISFTKSLFFTTFLQYNEQSKNFSHNTRIQWRYSNLSDLYIVYVDNYLPENFNVKNRFLAVKFNYWFSI